MTQSYYFAISIKVFIPFIFSFCMSFNVCFAFFEKLPQTHSGLSRPHVPHRPGPVRLSSTKTHDVNLVDLVFLALPYI